MPQEEGGGEKKVIVAIKQGTLLATAFYPELTADTNGLSLSLSLLFVFVI